MTGATGNHYCGLHEYEEMGFALHFLRPGDTFLDVGANVGSYTILAAERGARCIALEPSPEAFRTLVDNVGLNGFGERVELHQVAAGARDGTTSFTVGLDSVNHVATPADEGPTRGVSVRSLDALLGDRTPDLVKIDVEGFEAEVLAGAIEMLRRDDLQAAIVEANESGRRYGVESEPVLETMRGHGFHLVTYDPKRRQLSPADRPATGNALFVRSIAHVSARLISAERATVVGATL